MVGVSVEIRRYADDSFPGFVECWFTDAEGRNWSFIEKVPVVSTEDLDAQSQYPRNGVIACQIVERQVDSNGSQLVVIDTEQPWGVHSSSGETRFVVRPEQLLKFD
jgi:hypothetical protein